MATPTCRGLLELGARFDDVTSNGYTAAHCAIQNGHTDVLTLLAEFA